MLFSFVEHGDVQGELCDVVTIDLEEKLLYDIEVCKEEDDNRLLEADGDIKQLLVSMFNSAFVFIFISSKLEDVSSHE